jgi:thiamine-monophosphate kinase
MGDDCAVVEVPAGLKQILTTDSLTYGQHIDASVSAHDAGAKLIKRNLSDIAAMGGQPGHALLTLLCGPDMNLAWLQGFIEGIRETCLHYQLPIVGGDISAIAPSQFSSVLSLTGHLKHAPLLRNQAACEDSLYVTGTLGGSIYGKHYTFEPRLAEGQWLAQSQACSALMDLTDGLAKDLHELIPPAAIALLELDKIPISPEAQQRAQASGETALMHAFCDGEDYELLFCVKHGTQLSQFEQRWQKNFPKTQLTRIGKLSASQDQDGAYLNAKTKETLPWVKGFEHLTQQ